MGQPPLTRGQTLLLVVVAEGGMALLACGLGWLLGVRPWEQVAWQTSDAGLGVAAVFPLLGLLLVVIHATPGPLRSVRAAMFELVDLAFQNATLLDLMLTATLAGIGEEFLFRGVIQAAVARSSGQVWLGIAVGALAFGLAHPISRAYIVLATLVGAYLGWLAATTGNLLTPILVHGLYDAVALVYLVRLHRMRVAG
jgi:membrane protease YdiL (CAAX protease family)